MSKKTEMQTKGTAEMSTDVNDLSQWGDNTQVSKNDITLPKLLMAQHMSKAVQSKDMNFGDFYDSLELKKLGDIYKEPVEFIPFLLEKIFVEFEISKKGKREFRKIVPIVTDATSKEYNDNAPYHFERDGVKWERDRTMNFYVMLPKEIEARGAIPYVLSFRRTSLKAGKQLTTQMFIKNKAAQMPPPGVTMNLTGREEENDDGAYCVLEVRTSRQSTSAEMLACLEWFRLINESGMKIDNSDFENDKSGREKNTQEEGKEQF